MGSPTDVDHSGSQRITMLSVMSVFARRVRLTVTCEQHQKWTRECLCTERSDNDLVCFAVCCVVRACLSHSDLVQICLTFRFGSGLGQVWFMSCGRAGRRGPSSMEGLLDELGIHMSAVRVCCSFACYLVGGLAIVLSPLLPIRCSIRPVPLGCG